MTCVRARDKSRLEKLHAEYTASLAASKQLAEDCMRDPSRECSGGRRYVVDANDHRKAMQLCEERPGPDRTGMLGAMAPQPAAPAPRPGVDVPCRLWQFASVAVEVSPSKPGGAPWDGDGSPPETAFTLWLGERKIGFPTRSSYANGGTIDDGRVATGAPVKAALTDRDAMFDDRIALITDSVPETLEQGVWRLTSGGTSVSLRGRCVE